MLLRCAVAGLVFLPAMAMRAESADCSNGRSDKVALLDWSLQPGQSGPTISFRLKSNLPKAVRSIDATLVFEDSQGNRLAEMPLSPDLKIAAGAEGTKDDAILDPRMNSALAAENVKATICTRYVEYADGGFEEF
jgi:hypothetical protein